MPHACGAALQRAYSIECGGGMLVLSLMLFKMQKPRLHPFPSPPPSLPPYRQVIARIHTSSVPVRRLIHSLLVRIGRHHPQALMYPLLVACKSQSPSRRAAAMAVVDAVRQHSATLVEQAQLVSQELIRMAILWHEMWHEALEEASR